MFVLFGADEYLHAVTVIMAPEAAAFDTDLYGNDYGYLFT